MSTPGHRSSERVGDDERGAAIETLNEHWRAGRLDPTEHEARTTKAHAAVTRGDLDALFDDLPAQLTPGSVMPHDASSVPSRGQPSGFNDPSTPRLPTAPSRGGGGGGGLIPADSWLGRKRDAIMGVTPFAATALFFTTDHWQWFLAIPAMGAALYAGDGDHDDAKARRRLDRDERRRLRRERD